jgi:hypothetical protein
MTPSSVLVIKPSSLGDIVHTLPAVHFLKTTFRDADFYWIARSAKGRRILGLSDAREAAGYHYHERNPDAWIWKNQRIDQVRAIADEVRSKRSRGRPNLFQLAKFVHRRLLQ